MNLVLDTNILHQEALMSSDMRVLSRLVNSGFVTVCIPALVRREYTSKVMQDAASKFQSAVGSLEQVAKFARISRLEAEVGAAARAASELKAKLLSAYEDDFSEWSRNFKVRELPFDVTGLERVMNDYFAGNPPFRSPKAREDIPDSMIGMSIAALIAEVGRVAVATKDVGFQAYLKKLEGADVYGSVQEFLKTDAIQRELTRLDHEENVDEYLTVLANDRYLAAIARVITETQAILDAIYLEGEEVVGRERLEMDCFGVRVNAPIVGGVGSLHLGSPSYIGGGEYAFDLDMRATVVVDFCASYGEYLDLSYEREEVVRMDSMDGDGICDLQEDRAVRIWGRVIVDLAGVQIGDLRGRLLQGAGYADGLRISIDASKAEILTGSEDN